MRGRIMIVDDDQSLCETIEADLEPRGFDVLWHLTAEEAFATLKDGFRFAAKQEWRVRCGSDGPPNAWDEWRRFRFAAKQESSCAIGSWPTVPMFR